jgi:hypothetical protein
MTFKVKSKKLKGKKIINRYTPLYAVDYNIDDDIGTFEIFKTKKEAIKFQKKVNGTLWKADFDKTLVFMEDGDLNYDDRVGLYKNKKYLK